jgi:hypothetical protein
MPLQSLSDHYRAQQRLTLATLALVRREWRRMGDDLDASWRRVGPRIATLVAAAQVGAARDGSAYVPDALDEQGIEAEVDGTPRAEAFTGATSLDGMTYGSMDALLYGAVISARTAPVESLDERLRAGAASLDRLVHTQISDAGRMSASTAIAATLGAGWVRAVNPPCCQRCAVLAGKFFKSNEGFRRHPQCDCRHVPTTEANWEDVGVTISPDQVTDLTKAQRDAISEGADFNRVVNSRRGRSSDLMTTSELATRIRGRRLTPEGIYKVSSSREEVLRRLRDNGYLT